MNSFDKTMYVSTSVLIAISFLLLIASTEVEPNKFSTANLVLSYFTEIIWCALVVLLIRNLRGNKIVRRKNPEVTLELGAGDISGGDF